MENYGEYCKRVSYIYIEASPGKLQRKNTVRVKVRVKVLGSIVFNISDKKQELISILNDDIKVAG